MAVEIGALRALLSLDSAAFETGVKRAQASMSGLQKTTRNVGAGIAKAGKLIGAGIAAAGAGAVAGAVASARSLNELNNQAQLAGVSAEEFKVMALASRQFGVDQDKLADILKDTNDKFGDFIATGAGPLADFFENVAPQVGVTQEAFEGLSSSDALQLYVSSLEQANLSQQEMTFYMEALASDATALIPLFKENGAAINEMSARAAELGLSLDQGAVAAASKASAEFGIVAEVLKTRLGAAFAELLPAIADLAEVAIPALVAVIDGLGNILGAVAAILTGDFKGAWEQIRELMTGIGAFINQLGETVLNAAIGIGQNIIDGIKQGIANKWDEIKAYITDLASTLPGWIRKPLGINSPSRVMAEIGGFVMDGLREGIDGAKDQVVGAVEGISDEIGTVFDDVLFKGGSLRDGLRGIFKDIGNDFLQTGLGQLDAAVFGAGGLSGAISGLLSFDGGGFTGRGARSGGVDGRGGFPAILHPNETVIDHTKGGGMRGHLHITLDRGLIAEEVQSTGGLMIQANNAARDATFPARTRQAMSDPKAR